MSSNSYWYGTGLKENEYARLRSKYVPDYGEADSEQGDILRLVSRLYYRYYNDGDDNLSEFEYILKSAPIPNDIDDSFDDVFGSFCEEDLEEMVNIAINYCLRKEKYDKINRPDVDAKHELRYVENMEKKKMMDLRINRDRSIISPLRKIISQLELKDIKKQLSAKNIKDNGITKEELVEVLRGLTDYTRGLTDYTHKAKETDDDSRFEIVVDYLQSRRILTKKAWKQVTMYDGEHSRIEILERFPFLAKLETATKLKRLENTELKRLRNR